MESSRSEKFVNVSLFDLEKVRQRGVDEPGIKVYDVVHRETGRVYLLKEFNTAIGPSQRSEVRREFESLKGLDHPNLMKPFQLVETVDSLSVLLEHMDRGSVDNLDILTLEDLAAVAYQVLMGLDYLHKQRISHGDIKLSDIYVDSAKQVKILYLGKSLLNTLIDVSGVGTFHDEFSWDLWKLGFSLLKLFNDSHWRFEYDGMASQDEMWRFLCCCMRTGSSAGRWTAEDLVSHLFFKREVITGKAFGVTSPLLVVSESTISYGGSTTSHINKRKSTSCGGEENKISLKKTKSEMSVEIKDITDIEDSSGDHAQIEFSRSNDALIKRCIQHCFLFLPDCEFEKDKLIQMWIAEECIKAEGRQRLEDVGSLCFDDLVCRKIIKPSRFDNFYGELKYKINASLIPTLELDDYLRTDEDLGKIPKYVLHLTWSGKRFDQTSSHGLKNFKQLRTLRLAGDCGSPIKQLSSDIFMSLTDLQTLDLSNKNIFELPGSLGAMKSLRLLDVSGNPIKRLPESTDRLSRIQTLRLKGCFELVALPREFKNLKKLRHLDLDATIIWQLRSMPKGMGGLIELQTLKAFVVGKDDEFGIGELKEMNEITGSFCISNLENISSVEEAKKAALVNKKHIENLDLRWNDHGDDATNILECLQPNFHLKELQIVGFGGSKLPSWINNPLFADLFSITLFDCTGCHCLPSFGELPSLKILHIHGMKDLKNISALFCRTEGNKNSEAFSRLEKLTLEDMPKLEEWTGIRDGDFSHLCYMFIKYCPKLIFLPPMSHFRSLQHLELIHCVELTALPEGVLESSLMSLIIQDCPKVSEQCFQNGENDWFKNANIKDVWIDFHNLSLD